MKLLRTARRVIFQVTTVLVAAFLAVTLTAGKVTPEVGAPHYHHWKQMPVGFTLADLQHDLLNPGSLRTLYAEMSTAKSLGANTIRLQVQQDHLVGQGGHRYDAAYMSYVEGAVNEGRSLGLTMVINDQTEPSRHYKANESYPTRATAVFWEHVAAVYANAPHVVFDLFNEPRHESWQAWQRRTQALVNLIRHRIHAHNQIWTEGIHWASTMVGMPKIHGRNIVTTYHHPGQPWPGMAPMNIWEWDHAFGAPAAHGAPVVDAEFANSFGDNYHMPRKTLRAYLTYIKQHHIGLLVFGLAAQNLIKEYSRA